MARSAGCPLGFQQGEHTGATRQIAVWRREAEGEE